MQWRVIDRRSFLKLSGATVAGAVVGCGGGHSGTPSGGNNGGNNGGSVGTGTISEETRFAAIQAAGQQFNALPRRDRAADAQALKTWLQGRSEFAAAEIADDLSVFACFPDGRILCFENNDPLSPPEQVPSSRAADRITRATADSLPTGKTAKLFHMFGLVAQVFQDPRGSIGDSLRHAGYTVDAPNNVTLASLRTMGTVDVLFTNTHGGYGYKRDDKNLWPGWCMWTDQKAGDISQFFDQADAQLQDDLKLIPANGSTPARMPRVIYMFAGIHWWDLKEHVECHYAITAQFIKDYWQFGPNSLWFCNACYGDVDPNTRGAAFGNKLSLFAGWDNSALRNEAGESAKYFFDLASGNNGIAPASPPQRPFDVAQISSAMHAANPPKDKTQDNNSNPPVVANLHFEPNPNAANTFGFLTPNITLVAVDEVKRELRLSGEFGTTQGQAFFGGSAASVLEWQVAFVRCSLPTDGAGDVYVSVNGHESNHVPITTWSGHVKAQLDSLTRPGLFYTLDCDLRFRGDVHGFRSVVGGTPFTAGGHIIGARDTSTASFTAGGSHTDVNGPRTTVWSWSGGGSIPYKDLLPGPGDGGAGFNGLLAFDQGMTKMLINVYAVSFQSVTEVVNDSAPGGSAVNTSILDLDWSASAVPQIEAPLDASFNGAGGQNIVTQGGGLWTIVWSGFTADNPPTGATQRSVHRRR